MKSWARCRQMRQSGWRKQFVALPAMKLVQEIIEIARGRLLIPFQPKQLANIVVVKFVHERECLRNRVFPEFVQIILQLPVRVKEPGTYRTFGNTQDFTDLGMGHSLNMKHGDHSSVFIRQFHHSLVQSSLELGKVRFPHRAARGGQFEELLVVLDARVHIVEAEMKAPAALFEEIQGHVDRDGVDPGVERRFPTKPADRLVSLGKNVLERSFVSSWFEVML